jgi:hypothetical protein
MRTRTANHTLRILHISDLHARGAREHSQFARRLVLGEEWHKNLDAIRTDGPVDLVCFTGDIADWGRSAEYEEAALFVSDMLARLDVAPDRFFVIPGNHDVDRGVAVESWSRVRAALFALERVQLSRWMRGKTKTPFGLQDHDREAVISRCGAYRSWLKTIGRSELLPDRSPHGALGYQVRVEVPRLPFPVHVIGLDSAWLCGGDDDASRIWLTHDQLGCLCSNVEGEPLEGFRLGLVHHPLSALVDEQDAHVILANTVDVLLRGHVHSERFETLAEPDRALQVLAAGCLYEGDLNDQWPNACHVVDVTLDTQGRPLAYNIRFRSWSKRYFWYDDSSIYRSATNGRLNVCARSAQRSNGATPRDAMTIAQIEFIGAGGLVERRNLGRGDIIDVGRAQNMNIVFNDEHVSKHHVRFEASDAGLRVIDHGSKNKVFVNGVETTEAVLKAGNEVRLGSKGPLIRIVESLAATRTEDEQ